MAEEMDKAPEMMESAAGKMKRLEMENMRLTEENGWLTEALELIFSIVGEIKGIKEGSKFNLFKAFQIATKAYELVVEVIKLVKESNRRGKRFKNSNKLAA